MHFFIFLGGAYDDTANHYDDVLSPLIICKMVRIMEKVHI